MKASVILILDVKSREAVFKEEWGGKQGWSANRNDFGINFG